MEKIFQESSIESFSLVDDVPDELEVPTLEEEFPFTFIPNGRTELSDYIASGQPPLDIKEAQGDKCSGCGEIMHRTIEIYDQLDFRMDVCDYCGEQDTRTIWH